MIQLANDDRVQAYRTLLELDSRSREFHGLVLRLKDQVLNQSVILAPEVVASIDDLVWHLRRSAKLLPALERAVGVQRSTVRRGRRARSSAQAEVEGLRGHTSSLGIAEVIALLGSHHKSGTLWVKTDDECFLLEFADGAVVHATTNRPLENQRLGTILVARDKVSAERMEEEIERANDAPIGEIMLRAELVSESDLRDALQHQVQELFHRLYSVSDARFAFRDGTSSDLAKRVCLSTTQLLLESARAHDEGARDRRIEEPDTVQSAPYEGEPHPAATEPDPEDAPEDALPQPALASPIDRPATAVTGDGATGDAATGNAATGDAATGDGDACMDTDPEVGVAEPPADTVPESDELDAVTKRPRRRRTRRLAGSKKGGRARARKSS